MMPDSVGRGRAEPSLDGASDTSEIVATMCTSRFGNEPLYLSADNVAAKA